jgi:hypothetical protein
VHQHGLPSSIQYCLGESPRKRLPLPQRGSTRGSASRTKGPGGGNQYGGAVRARGGEQTAAARRA